MVWLLEAELRDAILSLGNLEEDKFNNIIEARAKGEA